MAWESSPSVATTIFMRARCAGSVDDVEVSELDARRIRASRPAQRGRDPAAVRRRAWRPQKPETIETVVVDAELAEPFNEEWLKRRRQTET